jgi:predicted nucleic acid-binding protein
MVTAVFDTNIIIDLFKGNPQAETMIAAYPDRMISALTYAEICVGETPSLLNRTQAFLRHNFGILQTTEEICDIAVSLRQTHRIKLIDAMIWATAKQQKALLITRNTKDFDESEPDIHVPYR